MSWKMYSVTFRLLSPLHVGWFKQGNLQRTRPYLSGKALWGALTARLARMTNGDYEKIGKQVNEYLAFSYFYPSTKVGQVSLWPWGEQADEFTWCYLDSYASTALNYEQNSAEEGSLHETECISPYTRQGERVYLVGYIFEKEDCSLQWRKACEQIQLGGERKYGWGRVQPEGEWQKTEAFWPGWEVELKAERPILISKEEANLYAHLCYSDSVASVRGTLEPLVGRETRAVNEHGQHIQFHGLAWAPGSICKGELRVQIGEFGILKPVKALAELRDRR
ncbi:MAG: CRISPR-associated protein [Anaerolineales bacterium]